MRASALLVCVFAAVSTPSFAVPIAPVSYGSSVQAQQPHSGAMPAIWRMTGPGPVVFSNRIGMPNTRRESEDVYELLARDDVDDDESGAGIFNIVKNVGSLIYHGISALTGSNNNQNQRRDFVDIMARAANDELTESDAINIKGILKGGLPFIGPLIGGLTSLLPSHSSGNATRREIETSYALLARAVEDDDESGAGIFSIIKNVGGALIKGIGALTGGSSDNNQKQRREYDAMFELLARAAEDDESGAGIFNIVKNVGSLIYHGISALTSSNNNQKQRREYDAVFELLARAAEEDDESGAGIFNIVKNVGSLIYHGISALTSGNNNNQKQRREYDAVFELLARAAEEDDESGAGIFSIVKNVGSLIYHGVEALTSSNNNNKQRRDFEAIIELLARADYDLE